MINLIDSLKDNNKEICDSMTHVYQHIKGSKFDKHDLDDNSAELSH